MPDTFDIPAYLDFLPRPLLEAMSELAEPAPSVPGLRVAPGLQAEFSDVETTGALNFTVRLYRAVRERLADVLAQRKTDRVFFDRVTADCAARNAARSFHASDYETVIGRTDESGRIVVGPMPGPPIDTPVVTVPDWIAGDQVTLFGPPDTAKLSINAMNAVHRRRSDEPELVAELVGESVPRWGADSEDSKTPMARDLLLACRNLTGCFAGDLTLTERGKRYAIAQTGRSLPIKRVPGLALPDGAHLLDGSPLPLHLVDFALHLWHNRSRPRSLVFYMPKLENEEEAAYLAHLIGTAEEMIAEVEPDYAAGSIRVLVVFENPRAIFRIREMAAALSPWFLGGSLGWHDFLASTARLFRHDPRYRIPVKADPDIVINHIKESHVILARTLGPLGALKLGGMYGVLFEARDPASYAVSMVGFIRDVVTQLRRGLDGFWVAHPDFVRVGLALVAAWRRREAGSRGAAEDDGLTTLITALVTDSLERERLLAFVAGDDVPGLAEDDPLYPRAVLAADCETSQVIANHDPEEVRYNVFQAVQYLADWLRGSGCVALPAKMTNAHGAAIGVRIMDDLATTERSRWELWAEVAHGRVSVETFRQILQDELAFIRSPDPDGDRRVAVPWAGDAAPWYPIAAALLDQLVTDPEPVEFVTELLLPFTLGPVRDAADPWAAAQRLCPGRYP